MPDPVALGSVKLSTWGTHHKGGNGMPHYIDTMLFGGNVGHAAVEVTIPANKEGETLVQKYCMDGLNTVIPFERVTQRFLDENNQLKEQDVYKVYFSWWPSEKSHSLHTSLNSDNIDERSGADVGEIDSRFTTGPNALNKREQRTYKGKLGTKKVTLADNEIAHLSSLHRDEKKLLEMERELMNNARKMEALSILEKKLKDQINLPVKGSLLTLLNDFIPDWKTVVDDPRALKAADIVKIQPKIVVKRKGLEDEAKAIAARKTEALEVVESAYTEAAKREVAKIQFALDSILEPEKRQKMIEQRSPPFSRQAWVDYELSQIEKIVKPADIVCSFCQQDFVEKKNFILGVLFDKNYPPSFKDKDKANIEKWRQFLPPEHQNITKEQMTPEIFKLLKDRSRDAMNLHSDQYKKLLTEKKLVSKTPNFQYADHERFITRGHSPNHQVRLPLSGIVDGEHVQSGLNAERMLQKMRALTQDGKKFDLATKNCSVTTGAILAAGAEPELRDYFEEKAWGGFGNPQEVLNGASRYQRSIESNKGKKTFWEKLSGVNPLNFVSYLGGMMLNKIASPDTSMLAKVGLGFLLLPVAGLAAAVETLKAVVNPKKTFLGCKDFINYAWRNNSIFLKFCTLPAAAIAGAAAIPAGIQAGIQYIGGKIISAVSSDPARRPPDPVVDRAKLPQDKIKEINEPDGPTAITKLTTMLRDEPNIIPVLSSQTVLNVNAYLKTLDRSKPEDVQKLDAYDQLIKEVYNRTNELSRPQAQPADVPARFAEEDPLAFNADNSDKRRRHTSAFDTYKRQSVTVHVPTKEEEPSPRPRSGSAPSN
ncbi:MAG: hypothetical protein BGO43_07615 [Gammaproteobacteria bacterium 39-13]|nr:MAG: hypothetical protein BGO43_07615 [Gammaproteobacteria bacterium 39-13]